MLLCCNMEGEFKQLLVFTKTRKTRCFKRINPKTLLVHWKNLLLLDNSPSHPPNQKLKSVKLVFSHLIQHQFDRVLYQVKIRSSFQKIVFTACSLSKAGGNSYQFGKLAIELHAIQWLRKTVNPKTESNVRTVLKTQALKFQFQVSPLKISLMKVNCLILSKAVTVLKCKNI